jgi:hypothetical protein
MPTGRDPLQTAVIVIALLLIAISLIVIGFSF